MTAAQKTSVIMVSYHTGPVLDKAIESVLAQDTDIELILVNNGNPPAVEKALIEKFKSDPCVRLMTGHGNIGFGRACNLGARVATGNYLLFLNPDSVLPIKTVSRLYEVSKDLPRPFMVGARLLDEDGNDQRGCRRALLTPETALIEALHLHRFFPDKRLNYHEKDMPTEMVPMPAISGAFMFMPAMDFVKAKGFDEDYFLHVEDLDLCWRFRQMGGGIYFEPSIVVTHVGGTSHVPNRFIEREKAKGFVRYFRNNFSKTTPAWQMWLAERAIWARYFLKTLFAR